MADRALQNFAYFENGNDEPEIAIAIADTRTCARLTGDLCSAACELIDAGDGCEWIVDARRASG